MRTNLIAACVLALGPFLAGQTTPTGLSAEDRNLVEVVKRGSAGVVHIQARTIEESRFEREAVEASTGSGFVISDDGYVVTAFHVIKQHNEVDVILNGGTRYPARLVGTAPQLDVALLQIEAERGVLSPLPLADSDQLMSGQHVIAIGNAMGMHNTVTSGIVSAVGRTIGSNGPLELQEAMIQTDAAVNPGNSGGPLLNSAGEVVGMNDAALSAAQNMSFAVPSSLIRRVIPDLIAMGHPYRPLLGFSGSEITPTLARLFQIPVSRGILVEELLPFGPASQAGLRAGTRVVVLGERSYVLGGDVITAADGQAVSSPGQLTQLLLRMKPGDTLRLQVVRGKETLEIAIPLSEMHRF